MHIIFEDWIKSQKISSTATDLFHEAVVCYKTSAYRASLLFSYLGFQTILKDRILYAKPPAGITPGQWGSIIKNITDDDTWDKSVFDTTQQKAPEPIFVLSDDVRNQVVYWRNRRNDCTHAKQNKIDYSHVEMFWSFIRSNLAKFVVNGSKDGLVNSTKSHFDYSLTPRGADFSHIIEQIPNAITSNELLSFFDEIYKIFHPNSAAKFIATTEERQFWVSILGIQSETISSKLGGFLQSKIHLLLDLLEHHPDQIHHFANNEKLIRKIWHDWLFSGKSSNHFPIYCSLLRNKLIPIAQITEAHEKIISRLQYSELSDSDFQVLQDNGFFDAFRRKAFGTERMVSNYEWANQNVWLIILYLEKYPLDNDVIQAIDHAFGKKTHSFDLKRSLKELFRENKAKEDEYLTMLDKNQLEKPQYLRWFSD
jgi:hypothetical protein